MQYLTTPLGAGILIIFIVFVIICIVINRQPIIKWFKRARITKLSIGPIEIESSKEQTESSTTKSDDSKVDFGHRNKFSSTSISKIAGRDITEGNLSKNRKKNSGSSVDFGENSDFSNSKIDKIAGRDIEAKDIE